MRPAAAISLSVAACMAAHAGPAPTVPAKENAPSGNPRAAVWKDQRVEFVYVGRTSRYSCEGLREKVRAMLVDLGARRDPSIVALRCESEERGPAGSEALRLKIEFSSPALPEPRAKPRREGDLAPVDARFQPFRIGSDAFRDMGLGDCELVQQFTRQLLPKLAARHVRQDIVCVPYRPSGSRFLVRGDILKALPPAEDRELNPDPGP